MERTIAAIRHAEEGTSADSGGSPGIVRGFYSSGWAN